MWILSINSVLIFYCIKSCCTIWNSVVLFDLDPNDEHYFYFETANPAESEIKHLYIRDDTLFIANNVSSRSDGGVDTNDLFNEDAGNPGHYIYYSRKDDILVLENGEKMSPIPMESTIRRFPIVYQVAVIGNGRHCTATLISLRIDYALDLAPDEMVTAVHDAVKESNKYYPKFNNIVPQMVKILSLSKKLPATDKSTFMRKKAEVEYKDIVERLYKDFLEGPERTGNEIHDISTLTPEQAKADLMESVASILNLPISTFSDGTKAKYLFDLGLDSLTSIQFCNKISECFKNIAKNFIFQHDTIDSMTEALISKSIPGSADKMKQRYNQTQELAE